MPPILENKEAVVGRPAAPDGTSPLDELLTRLEELLAAVEEFEEPARATVLELLDGLDTLHRMALGHLPDALGADGVTQLSSAHPALAWLLEAYGVGVHERTAAERALEDLRPYIASHGGEVEVVDARDGVVRVRMAGACAGCTASAVTLKEGVETALRDGLPGFVGLEVEDDDAAAHPPPGPTLLQIDNRLGG